MATVNYRCQTCETVQERDEQGDYPRFECDTCGVERRFVHPVAAYREHN